MIQEILWVAVVLVDTQEMVEMVVTIIRVGVLVLMVLVEEEVVDMLVPQKDMVEVEEA